MPLELDSLKKAVGALHAVLAKSSDAEIMRGLDEITRNAIKSGAIQHFEFTYELCWKFIKRWLEVNISPTAADGVTRRELFRLAAENRLTVGRERPRRLVRAARPKRVAAPCGTVQTAAGWVDA